MGIGIKASSQGPVFFISDRIGVNGKSFKMCKFRSMHIRKNGTNESQYLVNEHRIFSFGKFIRKSKIDELPQLINVFLGDMSIIGPRPYPKKYVDMYYTGYYSKILSVRPGLACLDSLYDYAHGELFVVNEREYSEQILPIRTELASIYIDNMSIKMDLYCIFRTIRLIFEIVIKKKRKFDFTKYELDAMRTRLNTESEKG